MNWWTFGHYSCPLPYIHTWPGQVQNRATHKHHKARKQRAIARRNRA